MARQEQDREDLLLEATALVQRVEIRLSDHSDSIVIGFRRDGSGSMFVGSDPVFQFNNQNELRRGFLNGKLIKAENGRLVELTRVRTVNAVQLRRRELNSTETRAYVELFCDTARQTLAAIAQDELAIVGQVPENANVAASAARWLAIITAGDVQVADRANL
jgi:hypothetical protein